MINVKNNKGISLAVLIVMIIVILILTGITIIEGTDLIKKTKIESLMTNMITIRAKAKVYAEEINSQIWDVENKSEKREELYKENYKMKKTTNESEIINKVSSQINDSNGCECYEISKETLDLMGLGELVSQTEDGEYIIVYNSADYTQIEVIYEPGITYENQTYYTLTSIQSKMGE